MVGGLSVNLHILFALAIGGSWAKERAGGAFAAGFAFILINRLTGSIFDVTSDILADKGATVHTLLGQSRCLTTSSVFWKLQPLTWVYL